MSGYFEAVPTWRQRLRALCSWHYWRQVGPMYRVTCWWLNRKAAREGEAASATSSAES